VIFPCERYIYYNLYLNKSPEEIVRTLDTKLLGKNVPVSTILLRRDRLLARLSQMSAQNKPKEVIAEELEIREMLDHFYVKWNPDLHTAFGILAWLPVRGEIERSVLTGIKSEDILKGVRDKFQVNLSAESLRLYFRYFFSPELSQQQWYWYLAHYDHLNYLSLVKDPDLANLERARRSNSEGDSEEIAQLAYVTTKAFKKLEDRFMEDDDDPDNCTKWFKLYAAAKDRIKESRITNKKPEDIFLDMGLTSLPDIPVRAVADFVMKSHTETDEDEVQSPIPGNRK